LFPGFWLSGVSCGCDRFDKRCDCLSLLVGSSIFSGKKIAECSVTFFYRIEAFVLRTVDCVFAYNPKWLFKALLFLLVPPPDSTKATAKIIELGIPYSFESVAAMSLFS
jgi:hypothetical protein